MTNISFSDVVSYLNAIADKSGVINGSPHKRFWNIPYNRFIAEPVPSVNCDNGSNVMIMNTATPLQSPFFQILFQPPGVCGNPQMPEGGPLITDPGYQVVLPNGTNITGKQIQDNIESWLTNGFPETAPGI